MGLTKLEAVNIILDSIGETPVSSLESGLPDAEAAVTKLDEINKTVQSKGWHQNTEKKLKLVPDSNKNIVVASNYLRVDTTGTTKNINVAPRKFENRTMLYDVKDQTFEFTKDLYCDVVLLLDFEDLTLELSSYIAYRAARKYQESQMQSTVLDGFTVRAEMEAYAALMDAETENEDTNILTDNEHCWYTTNRNHRLMGF
tara:strand:+ start:861 stop:1460 length:600 start_codon:yes stop_codon:yes gene_type:complete